MARRLRARVLFTAPHTPNDAVRESCEENCKQDRGAMPAQRPVEAFDKRQGEERRECDKDDGRRQISNGVAVHRLDQVMAAPIVPSPYHVSSLPP